MDDGKISVSGGSCVCRLCQDTCFLERECCLWAAEGILAIELVISQKKLFLALTTPGSFYSCRSEVKKSSLCEMQTLLSPFGYKSFIFCICCKVYQRICRHACLQGLTLTSTRQALATDAFSSCSQHPEHADGVRMPCAVTSHSLGCLYQSIASLRPFSEQYFKKRA